MTFWGPLKQWLIHNKAKRSIRLASVVFDISHNVSAEDKVMLVVRPDLLPATAACGPLAWGETSRDECVSMSVRHGSQQSMGQWFYARPGLSCAIMAEPFNWNPKEWLILSLFHFVCVCVRGGGDDVSTHFPLLIFVLSQDINASAVVIEVDCCEMTICNTQLLASLYYWAETRA